MAKYENIRALAKKKLQAVTESSDRWKAFLRTAAIAYNYSFPNQLLIHEQSPTATAVADIAYWNNNAGRWVKRGAHGIAVFDTRANSSRLRYLFDISDTIPRAEIPEALPWVITDQNWRPVWDKIVADNHADSIQSALLHALYILRCPAQRHVHNRTGKSHRRQQLTVGQAGRTAAAIFTAYHPKLSVYGRAAVRRGYCAAGPVCP